jgi:hypothetical protein
VACEGGLKLEREVAMMNIGQRIAVLDDDEIIEITDFIDKHGEFCEPEDAVICVAGDEETGWWSIRISEFRATLQN